MVQTCLPRQDHTVNTPYHQHGSPRLDGHRGGVDSTAWHPSRAWNPQVRRSFPRPFRFTENTATTYIYRQRRNVLLIVATWRHDGCGHSNRYTGTRTGSCLTADLLNRLLCSTHWPPDKHQRDCWAAKSSTCPGYLRMRRCVLAPLKLHWRNVLAPQYWRSTVRCTPVSQLRRRNELHSKRQCCRLRQVSPEPADRWMEWSRKRGDSVVAWRRPVHSCEGGAGGGGAHSTLHSDCWQESRIGLRIRSVYTLREPHQWKRGRQWQHGLGHCPCCQGDRAAPGKRGALAKVLQSRNRNDNY